MNNSYLTSLDVETTSAVVKTGNILSILLQLVRIIHVLQIEARRRKVGAEWIRTHPQIRELTFALFVAVFQPEDSRRICHYKRLAEFAGDDSRALLDALRHNEADGGSYSLAQDGANKADHGSLVPLSKRNR